MWTPRRQLEVPMPKLLEETIGRMSRGPQRTRRMKRATLNRRAPKAPRGCLPRMLSLMLKASLKRTSSGLRTSLGRGPLTSSVAPGRGLCFPLLT